MVYRADTIKDAPKEPFEFQISNWWCEDTDENEFVIRIFGTTANGESVHCRVNQFTPYFFIEVSEYWTPIQIQLLKDWLKSQLGDEYLGATLENKMRFFPGQCICKAIEVGA